MEGLFDTGNFAVVKMPLVEVAKKFFQCLQLPSVQVAMSKLVFFFFEFFLLHMNFFFLFSFRPKRGQGASSPSWIAKGFFYSLFFFLAFLSHIILKSVLLLSRFFWYLLCLLQLLVSWDTNTCTKHRLKLQKKKSRKSFDKVKNILQ